MSNNVHVKTPVHVRLLDSPACGRGGGARASRTRTSATSSGSARSGRGARTDSEPSRKSSSSGERTRERICAANHDLPFPRPHARALGKPFHVRVPSIVGGTGGRRADAGASRESSLPGVELAKLHHKAAGAGGGGGPLGAPGRREGGSASGAGGGDREAPGAPTARSQLATILKQHAPA